MAFEKMSSSAATAEQAAREIAATLAKDTQVVLFFASSHYPPNDIASAMQKALGGVPSLGCMTSGELISGHMQKNSVVALGLGSDLVGEVAIQPIADATNRDQIAAALREAAATFGVAAKDLSPATTAGIVLTDGMSVGEETVMETLSSQSNVAFIGGSAGDDLKFQQAPVYANGKVYPNGSVIALLQMKSPFEIVKTQSFDVLPQRLTVTKADEATRTIIEFNGQPATTAYAAAVGCAEEDLANHFMSNPLGLLVDGGEPFVRSPQQIDGTNVVFYCQIAEGMEMALLQGKNICSDTAMALADAKVSGESVAGIINFHCILRTLELEAKNQTEEYGHLFDTIPMVGFSTYGESYVGHINQTSTILVFRQPG